VELEISSVVNFVNLGGIQQPVISQEKVIHDIRMKDGEVSLLAGLKQSQDNTTVTGIPGLSSIPVIKWLFSSKTITKSSQELLIALIPHIVRRPNYTPEELTGVAVGNATVVKMNYAPRIETIVDGGAKTPAGTAPAAAPPVTPPATAPAVTPPATIPQTVAPPVTAPPPATAPPATAPSQTGGAAISFVPTQIDTILGGSFNVNLVVQNATDLFTAPMRIKFDPKLLRLNDVVQGNLMASDGQQVTFTKNILNDSGEANISLSRLPGSGGVTGSGMLVTLSFTTSGRGSTSIEAPGFTPTNSQGQPLGSSSPLLTVTIR